MSMERRWSSMAMAIALTVIALFLSLWLEDLITRTIGAFFYIAIAVSTWYGGRRSGIAATIFSLLLINYFLISPVHQIQLSNVEDVLQLVLIATVGIIINLLGTSLRESKEAEAERSQQLEVEHHRLEQILQQMPIGVAIAEAPTGKLLFHNDEAVRLLRHPLYSETYQDYAQYVAVHPDGQLYQPDEYPISRSLLSGEVIKAEEMHYHREDGTETIFSVSAAPILDPDGKMVATVSTFEDISDRKRAEQAVAKELLRIQTLFNTALDGIVIVDEQGRVLEANPRFAEMLGYTLEEVVTLSICDWDAQFTPEKIQQLLQGSLSQRSGIFATQHRRKDGSIYDVEVSYNVVEWDGNILRFCSCRDISERKRMEAERYQWQLTLQEQEASYRQLFENNPQPMWVYDLETLQFLAVNPAAISKYGYAEAEFLSMTIADIRPPQDVPRLLENVSQVTEGLDYAGDWQHQLKDGHLITVEIISHTLEFSGRRAKLVLANDITERKLAEEALQRSESRFRQMAMAAPGVIFTWVFHPEQGARYEYLNPYFERLHELSIAEAFADYNVVDEQIHPDDREPYRQVVAYCVETLQPFQHEWRIITPSGKVKWLYASAELEVRDNSEIAWHGVWLDLSDRKQAELALQELNQSLEQKVEERTAELRARKAQIRAIVEAIPDLLLRVKREGTSFASERLQHHVDDGLCAQNLLFDLLPPDLLDQQLDQIEQAIATGIPQIYEHHLLRGSDSIYEEVRIARISSNEALVIVRDISDRKQQEIALESYAHEVEDLYNNAPCGYCALDGENRVIQINNTALHWLASSREEVLGQPITQFITADSRQIFAEWRVILAQSSQVKSLEYEMTLLGSDGECMAVLVSEQVQKDVEGNTSSSRITMTDIRQRLRAERAVQQQFIQENLLRQVTIRIRQSLDLSTIFETACREVRRALQTDRVAIFQFYPEANFDEGEFIAESIDGEYPSVLAVPVHDHCFGKNFANLYAHGRYYAVADITSGGLADCHTTILRQFQVRANLIVPLVEGENALWGLLCVHQCRQPRAWQPTEIDLVQQIANQLAIAIQQARLFEQLQQELVDRQLAEQQLAERNQQLSLTNAELERATRLKDEFLANMSHELRTPLNAILGMSEGLQDGVLGEISQQQLEALQVIEHSGSHLLNLINDILDLAKIESGQNELDCAPANIKTLCRSSLEFVKQQALKKQIRLDLQCPSSLPELVMDERRILQVLVNLLNNAVKFTPNGGDVTLAVSLPVLQREGEARTWLRLTVQDTGIGIAPEYIPKLFQSFVQVDSALNRQYEGTGLGLALVKRIVEQHGGQVGLTSELGVGSCFTLDLPYITAQLSMPELPSQMNSNLKLDQSEQAIAPLILLVEDNEANILTISNYLQFKGNRLLVAREGQEAIALTQTEHPDLILMDIQMPGMDGIEAIQQIRRLPECGSIPIIALTALAMEGDHERCLIAGADDYLSKPVQLKQLVAKIQRILSSHQPE